MILTPNMAMEIGEALIDASQNVTSNNNLILDVVLLDNVAVSMPTTNCDYDYTVVHQVKS